MSRLKNGDTLKDQDLLKFYKDSGDQDYLGVLYQRYMHLIYGVCLRYLNDRELAKDAVMDIFEHLVKKSSGPEIEDFGKWVYVVAKNHCLMHLRKKEIRISHNEIPHLFMETGEFLHPDGEDKEELQIKELAAGMENLPEEQRMCLKLFYFEERSYLEITKETGFHLNKVKSYIQNGKRNLKNWIEAKSEGK